MDVTVVVSDEIYEKRLKLFNRDHAVLVKRDWMKKGFTTSVGELK